MIGFRLSELAQLLGGELRGEDAFFSTTGTDTRALRQGDLFVALRGPNFDGHDYLQQAAERGAVAAMVSQDCGSPLPLIHVRDTRIGLGRLASAWRIKAAPRVVAITGSNGKTTVKEMVASIMSQSHKVLATAGNFNNDIGVPLTLTRLQDEEVAVIEMGANNPGEIAYLSEMTLPDVALLNNAGRAHLEGFGTVQGVARAKAEILCGLAEDGVFVFNADDEFAAMWQALSSGRQRLTFGVSHPADVSTAPDDYRIEWHEAGFSVHFTINTPDQTIPVSTALAGEHNRMNALAATAAGILLGASGDDVRNGLAAMKPVKGRLCAVAGRQGARLVDDTYNANPDSVLAALTVLQAAPGRRTLVMGDLAEMGGDGNRMMAQIGTAVQRAGIDAFYTCGGASEVASQAYGDGARHFADQARLIEHLQETTGAEDTLLIKGSRSAAMERVVAALAAEDEQC